MIRTRIAQATAVAALALGTVVLSAPTATAVQDSVTPSVTAPSATASSSDNLTWG
ncbi:MULTISPECIES: hypothetical protein [Kitasatospora]|uniref:Uncharacterized protein n=1 Tax=Kitasatospora arboriphila TaxID=258052 RepID=A0ABP4E4T2_9ACTN